MEYVSYPEIGMYSNNNYIPDIGQFNNNSLISQPRCRPQAGNQGVQFTFAVPTQANSYNTFTLAQTHQPRGVYSNQINHQSIAPGIGTSWQHSVPNQMPWGEDAMSSQICPLGISTFSASPTFSAPALSIYSSIPSCSTTPKRPKRHSNVNIEDEAPKSKCRVTEEKMAARMEGLSLDCTGVSSSSLDICNRLQPDPDVNFADMMSDGTVCTVMSNAWKRFNEVENRLNSESDEEEFPAEENGVKVHITDSIVKNILESPPLIPQKLLNDLNRPCMELVLWKNPGGFNPQNKKNIEPTSTQPSSALSEQKPSDSIVNSLSINSNISKPCMDEEYMESYEDDMDSYEDDMDL